MDNTEKVLRICEDLRTLSFIHDGLEMKDKPYTLTHPDGNYELWVANGPLNFYVRRIKGEYVDHRFEGDLGLTGKILVWYYSRKHIKAAIKDIEDMRQRNIEKMFK